MVVTNLLIALLLCAALLLGPTSARASSVPVVPPGAAAADPTIAQEFESEDADPAQPSRIGTTQVPA